MYKKAIIFDFDGTIADTLSLGVDIANDLSSKYGYRQVTGDDVKRFQGMTAGQILKEMDVSPRRALIIGRQILKIASKRASQIDVFNGVPEAIALLRKKGYLIGIVTKNSLEIVKAVTSGANIPLDFLEKDKSLFLKEKIIRKVINKEGLAPENVVYVGDEVRDIEAARKAGVGIISVGWGYNSLDILQKYNDRIVLTPDELPFTVDDILKH